MHGTLARIFTDYSIDDDFLFSLVKPPILASKPTGCLTRAWGHEEPREESNNESQKTLRLFVSTRIKENVEECCLGSLTSIRKSHRHPAFPEMPRMCNSPYASKADMISAKLRAVQKKPSLIDNSACL